MAKSEPRAYFVSPPGMEECKDSFLRDYEPLEVIGKGSFSEVLKCKKRENGGIFACKRMSRPYKSWRYTRETFAATVVPKNPNILQLLEVHFDLLSGQLSLVYDIMDTDLLAVIRGARKDEITILDGDSGRVCSIMYQILSAVAHLHKHGVFHCDLKPENILLKLPEYLVKLADFGNVQRISHVWPHGQQYAVSRWYRPPECILTFGYYGPEIDLWSVGCIFYELLTRRVLFRGQSEMDQLNVIHEAIGPPPIQVILNFCVYADLERNNHGPGSPTHQRFNDIDKVLKQLKSGQENLVNFGLSKVDIARIWLRRLGLDSVITDVENDDARSLLRLLIQYDPKSRPTPQGAMMHFYFKEYRENRVYGFHV